MKKILTKELFGKEADFFIDANNPKIIKVHTIDKKYRSAVEITIEVETETTQSICECGCGFETGSPNFVRLHVGSQEDYQTSDELQQRYKDYLEDKMEVKN